MILLIYLIAIIFFIKSIILMTSTQSKLSFSEILRMDNLKLLIGLILVTIFSYLIIKFMNWSLIYSDTGIYFVGSLTFLAGSIIYFTGLNKLSSKNVWSDSGEVVEGSELVTDGVYAFVRHPIYTAFILVGICFIFLSPIFICIGILSCSIAFNRVSKEEENLIQRYGEEYKNYIKR